MEGEPERSPRSVGYLGHRLLVWAGALLGGAFGAAEFWPQYRRWIFGAAVLVSGWSLLMQVFAYRTAGMCGERGFSHPFPGVSGQAVSGYPVWEDPVSQVETERAGKRWKMAKGQVYLLAGSGDRSHKIPYFRRKHHDS